MKKCIAGAFLLLALISCKNDIGQYNNPVDPQNAASIFSQDIHITQGSGVIPISTFDTSKDITFDWEPLEQTEQVQFQLGNGPYGEESTYTDHLVHEDSNATPPIGPITLDTDLDYVWRVRYGGTVDFEDGTQEFIWSSWMEQELRFSLDMEVREFSMTGTLFGETVDLQSTSAMAIFTTDRGWFNVGDQTINLMIRNRENIVEGTHSLGDLSLGLSIYHEEIVRPNIGINDYWPDSGTITFDRYIQDEFIQGSYSLQGENADISGAFSITYFEYEDQ